MPCSACSSNPSQASRVNQPTTVVSQAQVGYSYSQPVVQPNFGGDITIESLPNSYPFTSNRELDTYVRMLGRGSLDLDTFMTLTDLDDSDAKSIVSDSLKRLYSSGYLTNEETQNTIKLFGSW